MTTQQIKLKALYKDAYSADANGLILEDGDYRLEENINYAPGCGNIFLMRGLDCVGGADRVFGSNQNVWTATLHRVPPKDDPDSDAFPIAENVSRAAASDHPLLYL
jgi:hypothetical protein